jgi:hypothetical protein
MQRFWIVNVRSVIEFYPVHSRRDKIVGTKIRHCAAHPVAGFDFAFFWRRNVSGCGTGELAKISKLHFRTALRAQGLLEPPKTEWRKK